jgi:glutaminyl-tRNA synthetase
MYDCAERLVELGQAYVDDLTADEIRQYRGTLTEPGRDSPHRTRSRRGEPRPAPADAGRRVPRRLEGAAREDRHGLAQHQHARPGALPDPPGQHHRTGDTWCIYPMYDYAHPLEDAIEGITHSLCTLEFEDHRPLYDWVENALDTEYKPQQIEFARLNLSYTVMSKRKLLRARAGGARVRVGRPAHADDRRHAAPRLHARRDSRLLRPHRRREEGEHVDVALLEHCVREELNRRAPRVMGVLRPLRLVIENYPEGQVERSRPSTTRRTVGRLAPGAVLARALHRARRLPRGSAEEVPPALARARGPPPLRVHREVRTASVKDEAGDVVEVRCTIRPRDEERVGPAEGRRVKGTIHWVSAAHALRRRGAALRSPVQVAGSRGRAWTARTSSGTSTPTHSRSLPARWSSPVSTASSPARECSSSAWATSAVDPDSRPGAPVFNRTVGLRDSWAKIEQKQPCEGAVGRWPRGSRRGPARRAQRSTALVPCAFSGGQACRVGRLHRAGPPQHT